MHKFEVLQKCKENLTKADSVINDSEINHIIKIMTKPLIGRIREIEKICSVDKYNMCFIGEVGVGKSTAIANLLGLIDKEKLSVGSKLTELPLLKTAEGRTTLCETEICFTDTEITSIKIESINYSKFKDIVNDFCLKLLKKSDDIKEEVVECPSEVQRVIRNMSGFPIRDRENQEEFVKKVLADEFREDVELYKMAQMAILKEIKYENRTRTEIICPETLNIEAWIKSAVFNVNDGKMSDVPYPSKISIILNTKDLDISIPSFIEKIRDTRGIDGSGVREDINEICKDICNISIICDGIKDYGNIVSEGFLKNQFIIQNKDLKYRNFVMGLEQGAQLSKVNDADGRESGKDIKKEEALNNWNFVCLDEHNMLFYNSYLGVKYDSEELKIIEIDIDKYNIERESLLKNIESKINFMYEEYSRELSDINQKLNIFSRNVVEDFHKKKLTELRLTVETQLQALTDNFDLFFKRLEDDIKNKTLPGYIRGSINRKGIYDNYNFYAQAKNISYEEFEKTTSSPLFYLERECERLFNNQDMMEEALELAIKYKINELYNNFRDKNASDYEEIVKAKIGNDSVWSLMSGYWGDKIVGYKYRDRVADTLLHCVKEKKTLEEIIDKKNTYNFFTNLSKFLNIEV